MKKPSPFLLLKAFAKAHAEPEPPAPRRLSDPLQGALTEALRSAKLWAFDQQTSLERDGRNLTIRLFDPEHSQVARETQDRREATEIKRVIIETLQANGYAIRFSDALFCERGKKGWEIIVKARELR